MQIRFYGRDYDKNLDFEGEIKLREALIECGIFPSTVVVSFDDQILPLSTIIKNDIELLVTTVSSGGYSTNNIQPRISANLTTYLVCPSI